VQLIVTLLLCAQLIDVLTTGADVCWAELPPGRLVASRHHNYA